MITFHVKLRNYKPINHYHISLDYAHYYFATRIINGEMGGETLAHDYRAIASMAYGCNIEIRIICSVTRDIRRAAARPARWR